jgi:hypothetical protein
MVLLIFNFSLSTKPPPHYLWHLRKYSFKNHDYHSGPKFLSKGVHGILNFKFHFVY